MKSPALYAEGANVTLISGKTNIRLLPCPVIDVDSVKGMFDAVCDNYSNQILLLKRLAIYA